MAVVNATGGTLRRRPDTFDMARPSGYFKSGIIRKLNDDEKFPDWGTHQSGNPRNPAMVSGRPW